MGVNKRAQKALIDQWIAVPIGTPVVVTQDDGKEFHTVTRTGPWMLGAGSDGIGGHTAVIMVEGISGAYSLERIRKK